MADTQFKKNREKIRNLYSSPIQTCKYSPICCDKSWKRVKTEKLLILNMNNNIERNKQINSTYADLYLSDPKIHLWAGTASIVSKQVGCTMQNNIAANNNELGIGNKAIYENIYPSLKMYDLLHNKLPEEDLLACIKRKIGIYNYQPLEAALRSMLKGNGRKAAIIIATHEQEEIIENAMWKGRWLNITSALNTIALGQFADTSVYFVPRCEKDPEKELKFPKTSNVAYSSSRISFYKTKMLPQFYKIESNNSEMLTIMKEISKTGGIRIVDYDDRFESGNPTHDN